MSSPLFRLNLINTALITSIGLSGCLTTDNSEESKVKLSGVVSKGIIVGGKVYAYPIIDGVVVKTTILGEAITGADGKYSIDINGYNGPVSIVVSPAADDSSKVKCDVPDGCSAGSTSYTFGQLMPLDYDLEAIVPKVTGGSSVSASVTPLTHMAAAYAKELGLTSDTVELANEKVATLLDVDDILSVEPVDVTDPTAVGASSTSLDSIKYGYIAASIAAIANEDNGGDVGSAIDSLAESYVENNGELVGNEATNDASVISLAEITTNTVEIMAAEEDVSGGVFALVKEEVEVQDTAATDSSQTDAATSTTTTTVVAADNVDSAKEIVTELRTWATMLQEDMQAGSEGFMNRAELAMDASSADMEQVIVGMATSVVVMADAYLQEKNGDISGGTYNISDHISPDMTTGDLNQQITGTGSIVVSGNTVSISNATVNGADINLSIAFPASASGTEFSVSMGASTASTDDIELKINASTASLTFANSITDIYSVDMDAQKVTQVSLDLGAALGHKSTSTAEHKINFSGDVDAVVLVNYSTWSNGEEVEDVNPKSVTMEGSFSVDDDSFSAKLEMNMLNAATFTRIEPAYLEGNSYASLGSYEFSTDGNTLTLTWPDRNVTFVFDETSKQVTRTRNYNDGYIDNDVVAVNVSGAYTETFLSLDDFISKSGKLSGAANWTISVDELGYFTLTAPTTWSKDGGNISATLESSYDDEEEDATHWRDIDGKLTLVVGFTNLPEASVVATVDRSGYQAGTGSLTMKYDDVTIVVSGNLDVTDEEDPQADGSVVITTAKGTLEVYPDLTIGGLRGSVKVGGEVVGSIKPSKIEDALIVTYVNGDFETLVF